MINDNRVFHGMTNLSVGSLYIEMFFNDSRLCRGTGFLVKTVKGYYLITNRHNVTGRRQDDNQPIHPSAGIPNKIKIYMLNRKLDTLDRSPSVWSPIIEPLLDEQKNPLWIEHPLLGSQADFVALKVEDSLQYKYILMELNNHSCKLAPSDRVNILDNNYEL